LKNITIYCFRNDLRLFDNAAFLKAAIESDILLPLFCHPNNQLIHKDIQRIGIHRQTFLRQTLNQLKDNLKSLNSDLLEVNGNIYEEIKKISEKIGATKIILEKIISPEELDQENSIRSIGIPVETFWQSSMIEPTELPFDLKNMPDIFTDFRKLIEANKILTKTPTLLPEELPPLPDINIEFALNVNFPTSIKYEHTSFPYLENQFYGGEKNALAHLENYLIKKLPHTYKETRNQLYGINFSTKFSPKKIFMIVLPVFDFLIKMPSP
jgi:deoxyribodipyrimidine photo-lyase